MPAPVAFAPLVVTLHPFSALTHGYPALRSSGPVRVLKTKAQCRRRRRRRWKQFGFGDVLDNALQAWTAHLQNPSLPGKNGPLSVEDTLAWLSVSCSQTCSPNPSASYLPFQVHVPSPSTAQDPRRLTCLDYSNRLTGPLASGWTWPRNSTPTCLRCYTLALALGQKAEKR